MKDSKILSRLCFKVRVRSLSLSEQTLHHIFVSTKKIQSHSFFSLKQKGKTNNFGWYLLNMYATNAYNKKRINSTFSKVQVLQSFEIKKSYTKAKAYTKARCKNEVFAKLLYVRITNKSLSIVRSEEELRTLPAYQNKIFTTYNNHKTKSLFTSLNKLSCVPPIFLYNVKGVVRKRDIIKQSRVWFNKMYKAESVRNIKNRFLQHLVRAAEISVLFGRSKECLGRQCLQLNDIVDYKILTLRSRDQSFPKWEKHKMIRPLLGFKRETITMVCKDFKMPVYPDKSNRSIKYSRNRIRKQIIPSIKYFINPQVEDSLFKLAELLNKEQFFLYSILRNR